MMGKPGPDAKMLRDIIKEHLLDFKYTKDLQEVLDDIIMDAVHHILEELTLIRRDFKDCECQYTGHCGCQMRDYNDAVNDLEALKEKIYKAYSRMQPNA